MGSGNAARKSTSSKKATSEKTTRNARKRTDAAPGARGKASAGARDIPESHMSDDIIGVCVAVLSIALFVAVVYPTDAVLAHWSSNLLFLLFGLGAYIVPVGLFLWSTTFFIHRNEGSTWRFGLGMALIIIAILAILSCFTPDANNDVSAILARDALVSRGGYLGAGIAWALMKLFGRVISVIILIGVAIVGAVVIGLSISDIVQRSQEAFVAAREQRAGAQTPTRRRSRTSDVDAAEDDFTRRLAAVDDEREPSLGSGEEDDQPTRADVTRVSKRKPKRAKPADDAVTEPLGDAGATVALPGKGNAGIGSMPAPSEGFELPSPDLLKVTSAQVRKQQDKDSQSDLREVAAHLQESLESFNLNAEVVKWVAGPTFTLFHIRMPSGVKVAKIMSLQDDIALALAAESVRIFAPIPGTSYVGVEIPNRRRSTVLFGDVLGDIKGGPLEFAIGRNVEGETIAADLAEMPHLLIAGTTGSGKSVAINSLLMSILMRATPSEVRMILIDPKRVEMSFYNDIPHLYVPVVSDTKEVVSALTWATIEMERRFKVFQKAGTRKISTYNALVLEGRLDDEAEQMPYIVIVIDELSDLMMTAGKEVESSIVRLAQLARAAGIHLVVATQRPASNIVTGAMKANITNRMALKVATGIDSRVIIDQVGAEKLTGHGDLLFLRGDGGEPDRIQGCYVSDGEIQQVVSYLKTQAEPEYNVDILNTVNVVSTGTAGDPSQGGDDDDPLLWDAAEIVVSSQMGSTSNIQRRLRVGYARAGRIMDQLESHGVVGPPDGSRPREVMVGDVMELESLKALDEYDEGNVGSDV